MNTLSSARNTRVTNIVHSSHDEKDAHVRLTKMLKETPIPEDELLANLGLYMTSKNLSRILFFYEIYQLLVGHHGIIMEFGTRWGQTLSILSVLRGIFEPFNRVRRIVGFDTFSGHEGICREDGDRHQCSNGDFGVSPDYERYLEQILTLQEELNPISHIKKFELIKGDVVQTLPSYLKKHPETLISLAVFDMDIYKPTRTALEMIRPYCCKGTILVFDDVCDEVFPGETIALREVFDLNRLELRRMSMTSRLAFLTLE